MRLVIALLALAGLAACGDRTPAGNTIPADPGAAKFKSVCQDCHGPQGEGRGIFPRLAGRPAAELAARLRQYKSGHKIGNMSDAMKPFAMALSDQEIDQVATWLATR